MAGAGGVPAGHAVAVEVPVVLLQLLKAVKGHKAVLALVFHAQKVLPPATTPQNAVLQLVILLKAFLKPFPDTKHKCQYGQQEISALATNH